MNARKKSALYIFFFFLQFLSSKNSNMPYYFVSCIILGGGGNKKKNLVADSERCGSALWEITLTATVQLHMLILVVSVHFVQLLKLFHLSS